MDSMATRLTKVSIQDAKTGEETVFVPISNSTRKLHLDKDTYRYFQESKVKPGSSYMDQHGNLFVFSEDDAGSLTYKIDTAPPIPVSRCPKGSHQYRGGDYPRLGIYYGKCLTINDVLNLRKSQCSDGRYLYNTECLKKDELKQRTQGNATLFGWPRQNVLASLEKLGGLFGRMFGGGDAGELMGFLGSVDKAFIEDSDVAERYTKFKQLVTSGNKLDSVSCIVNMFDLFLGSIENRQQIIEYMDLDESASALRESYLCWRTNYSFISCQLSKKLFDSIKEQDRGYCLANSHLILNRELYCKQILEEYTSDSLIGKDDNEKIKLLYEHGFESNSLPAGIGFCTVQSLYSISDSDKEELLEKVIKFIYNHELWNPNPIYLDTLPPEEVLRQNPAAYLDPILVLLLYLGCNDISKLPENFAEIKLPSCLYVSAYDIMCFLFLKKIIIMNLPSPKYTKFYIVSDDVSDDVKETENYNDTEDDMKNIISKKLKALQPGTHRFEDFYRNVFSSNYRPEQEKSVKFLADKLREMSPLENEYAYKKENIIIDNPSSSAPPPAPASAPSVPASAAPSPAPASAPSPASAAPAAPASAPSPVPASAPSPASAAPAAPASAPSPVPASAPSPASAAPAAPSMPASAPSPSRAITYDNGEVYKGDTQNDMRHGYGTYTFNNDDFITGEWRKCDPYNVTVQLTALPEDDKHFTYDGEIVGYYGTMTGTMKYTNGSEYEGEFVYSGEIYNGKGFPELKREGKGKYKTSEEDFIDCEWSNDKPVGKVTMVYSDVGVYTGDIKGPNETMEGKMKMNIGSIYKGDFQYSNDDAFNGKLPELSISAGTARFSDESVYKGAFNKIYEMHGNGRMDYSGRVVYNGMWKNGKRDGFGKEIDCSFSPASSGRCTSQTPGAVVYQGLWENDMKHGEGVLTSGDEVTRGKWKEGSLYSVDGEEEVEEASGSEIDRARAEMDPLSPGGDAGSSRDVIDLTGASSSTTFSAPSFASSSLPIGAFFVEKIAPDDVLSVMNKDGWLTDTVIKFGMHKLKSPTKGVEYIPSATFERYVVSDDLLRDSEKEELSIIFAQSLVLIPINGRNAHWALLAYRKERNCFEYYNSSDSFGTFEKAEDFVNLLKVHLIIGADVELVKIRTPRQRNGFDCGVYVLRIADMLADNSVDDLLQFLSPKDITECRRDLSHQVRKEAVHQIEVAVSTDDLMGLKSLIGECTKPPGWFQIEWGQVILKNDDGKTTLMLAAEKKSVEAFKFLLNCGPYKIYGNERRMVWGSDMLTLRDNGGRNVLDYVEQGTEEGKVMEALIQNKEATRKRNAEKNGKEPERQLKRKKK